MKVVKLERKIVKLVVKVLLVVLEVGVFVDLGFGVGEICVMIMVFCRLIDMRVIIMVIIKEVY